VIFLLIRFANPPPLNSGQYWGIEIDSDGIGGKTVVLQGSSAKISDREHIELNIDQQHDQQRQQKNENKVLVIDSIMYNGEPVLLTRLELLYDVVDFFYITESNVTHSGQPKPLYGQQLLSQGKLHKYQDKLTFLLYDPAITTDKKNWGRENGQRKFAADRMKQDFQTYYSKQQKIVIINTDVDELPNPHAIREFQEGGKHHVAATTSHMYLEMEWFSYNCFWKKRGKWSQGHTIPGYKLWEGVSLQTFRDWRKIKKASPSHFIKNGGWHLTYFLSIEDIQRKLESTINASSRVDLISSLPLLVGRICITEIFGLNNWSLFLSRISPCLCPLPWLISMITF